MLKLITAHFMDHSLVDYFREVSRYLFLQLIFRRENVQGIYFVSFCFQYFLEINILWFLMLEQLYVV